MRSGFGSSGGTQITDRTSCVINLPTNKTESVNNSSVRQNFMRFLRYPERVLESSNASPMPSIETMRDLGSNPDVLVKQRIFSFKPNHSQRSAESRHVRSSSQTSIDNASLLSHPRSVSFSEASSCTNSIFITTAKPAIKSEKILSPETLVHHQYLHQDSIAKSQNSDKYQFKYLSAKAFAEKLAKVVRGNLKKCPKNATIDRTACAKESRINVHESVAQNSSNGRLILEKPIIHDSNHQNQVCKLEHNKRLDSQFEKVCTSSGEGSVIDPNGVIMRAVSGKTSGEENDANDNAYAQTGDLSVQASEEQNAGRHVVQLLGETPLPVQSHREELRLQPYNNEHNLLNNSSYRLSIDGHLRQIICSNENLQKMVKAAEEKLATLEKEITFPIDNQSPNLCKGCKENASASIEPMQQTVKQLQNETKLLVQEIVSQVKTRIIEQEKVKEIFELMKKETVYHQRYKTKIQTNLENELQRREEEWCSKLKKMQAEERRLRERVRELAEEKIGLQKELASAVSKGTALTAKLRSFELQSDAHKKRLGDTEKTILELRQSLMISQSGSIEAERELDELRNSYKEKDAENIDLRRLIGRLQQLCTNHERSIQGLWHAIKKGAGSSSEDEGVVFRLQQELVRLSRVEHNLRNDLEFSRREVTTVRLELSRLVNQIKIEKVDGAPFMNSIDRDYQEQLHTLHTRIKLLQNENVKTIGKLKVALKENQDLQTSFEVYSVRLSMEGDAEGLQKELMQEKDKLRKKEKNLEWLDIREDAKDVIQKDSTAVTVSEDTYSLKNGEISDEKSDMKAKSFQLEDSCFNHDLGQLQMTRQQLELFNGKVECLSNKLSQRESELLESKVECDKKEEVLKTLRQNVHDMKKALDTHKWRIQQLNERNKELFDLNNTKERESLELQINVRQEADRNRNMELELEQVKERLKELQGETKIQELHCDFLREKLCSREVELEHSAIAFTSSTHDHDMLQHEIVLLQTSLHDSNQRVLNLEDQLSKKEEKVECLQAEFDKVLRELLRLRNEFIKVSRQRDNMRQEADDLGREALRISAEVEVLRRKVDQLEEDIMLKEGQLAILQGSLEGCECCSLP